MCNKMRVSISIYVQNEYYIGLLQLINQSFDNRALLCEIILTSNNIVIYHLRIMFTLGGERGVKPDLPVFIITH